MNCDEKNCKSGEAEGICNSCGNNFKLCINHLREHQKKKHNILLLNNEELENMIRAKKGIDLQKNFLKRLKEFKYKIIQQSELIIKSIRKASNEIMNLIIDVEKNIVVSNERHNDIEYDLIIKQLLQSFQQNGLSKENLGSLNNVLSHGIDIEEITNIFSDTIFEYIDFINNNKLENPKFAHSEKVIQKSQEILSKFEDFKTSNRVKNQINLYNKKISNIVAYQETDEQLDIIKMRQDFERITMDLKLIDKSLFTIKQPSKYTIQRGDLNISIYEGTYRGKKVCVKIYTSLNDSIKYIEKACNEIRIYEKLSELSKPDNCFIEYYGSYFEGYKSIYMIMDWYDSTLIGIIHHLQKTNFKFSEIHYLNIIYRLLQSFTIMADYGILHNDIKPHNILADYNWNIKIIDFDISLLQISNSSFSMTDSFKIQGTTAYLAPELKAALNQGLSHAKFNREKADVYSLGLVFYQLLFYKNVQNLRTQDFYSDIDNLYEFSEETKNILKIMLKEDPSQRPLFREVLYIFLRSSISNTYCA